ncbi:MAG: hypothetical protein HY673_05720 [Chloroflexi bacterium]|nr:hypothetical protein [Chloroflexota bacterium]
MFDPDLFWQYSEALLKDEYPDKCRCRIAAGRAYYAFFLITRNRLEAFHKVKFRHAGEDHSMVIRELRHRNRHAIADRLDDLLRLRELADYDMAAQVDINQVSFVIDEARNHYSAAKTL